MIVSQKDRFVGAMRVAECFNLRPVDGCADRLAVAPTPLVLASGAWTPLSIIITPTGERRLIVADGNTLAQIFLNSDADTSTGGNDETDSDDDALATPTVIATLPGSPRTVLWCDNILSVMTESGLWTATLNDDGSWLVTGLRPDYPAVAIVADDAGEFSTVIDPPAFAAAYTSDDTPSAGEIKALTSAIQTAYEHIADDARTAGALIAPVFARARVLDDEGNVIHVYPPTLLRPTATSDFDTTITFASDDRQTMARRQVSARAFRPRVIVTDSLPANMRHDACKLVLDITPCFHPIDLDGTARVSFGRVTGTDYVRVTLPSAGFGMSPGRAVTNIATTRRVLARFDDIVTSVLTVNDPFSSAGSYPADIVVSPLGVRTEIRTLTQALQKDTAATAATDPILATITAPHNFTAAVGDVAAHSTLWGNVRALPFAGYSPLCFATAFDNKTWRARAMVTFQNGDSAVIWQGEGTNYAPTAFAPLISYPLAGADAITVIVEVDGVDGVDAMTFTRRLYSTPDVAISWSLEKNLAGITCETPDELTLPSLPKPQTLHLPNGIVATKASSPRAVLSVASLSATPTAILTAPARSGAWEFGRERFYAFTAGGTRLLTLSSDHKHIVSNIIDNLAVNSRRFVTNAGSAVYASDGTSVNIINTNHSHITIASPGDIRAIGWDAHSRQLLVARGGGVRHYLPDDGYRYYDCDPESGDMWLSLGGDVFAGDGERIISLTQGVVKDNTAIRWQASAIANSKPGACLDSVTWHIDASRADVELRAARNWLGIRHASFTRTHFTGAIHTPLTLSVAMHRFGAADISVDGRVSADFVMTLPSISECKRRVDSRLHKRLPNPFTSPFYDQWQ